MHFQTFNGNIDKIFRWKTTEQSKDSITTPTTSNNSFAPKLAYIYNSKIAVRLEVNCLKQGNVFFSCRNVVSHFIVYELYMQLLDLTLILY